MPAVWRPRLDQGYPMLNSGFNLMDRVENCRHAQGGSHSESLVSVPLRVIPLEPPGLGGSFSDCAHAIRFATDDHAPGVPQ